MSPQSWQVLSQISLIIGGFLTISGGAGIWYFSGKAMDEKLNEIISEIQAVPQKQQYLQQSSEARKKLAERLKELQSKRQRRATGQQSR